MSEPAAQAQVAVPAKPAITRVQGSMLQRQCACGQHIPVGSGECEECKQKRENTLQRSAINSASVTDAPISGAPPIIHEALRSPGRPLEPETRTLMESRFGYDFSSVRVHDDALAARSAQAVRARAYTVGQDIAFAPGQYQPRTAAGARLLAHELAHTVQQTGLRRSPTDEALNISAENDPSEREAAAAAESVMEDARPDISVRPPALFLNRAPWGDCPPGIKRKLNDDLGEMLKKRNVAPNTEALEEKTPRFFTQQAAEAAELYIANHFKLSMGDFAHTNNQPLSPDENANPEGDPEQYMINEAYDHLRSGGSTKPPKKKKAKKGAASKSKAKKPASLDAAPTLYPPQAIPPAPEDEEIDENRAAETVAPGRSGAQLKPDLVEFGESKVYDVTTLDGAREKVLKLKGYAKLYETIRSSAEYGPISVPVWTVGASVYPDGVKGDGAAKTELSPPSKLSIGLQNEADPIKICFAVTDFAKYPGVLAYVIIDTSAAPGADAAAAGSTSEPYEIEIRGQTLTIYAQPAPATTDLLNSGPANKAVAESIPGAILHRLNRVKKGLDTIEAEVETSENSKSQHNSKIPFKATGQKAQVVYQVKKGTNRFVLQSKKVNIPIEYQKLSAGAITDLDDSAETGLSGKGYIRPSIPLLRNVNIQFAFSEDSLNVTIPVKKPHVPIPGFNVTKFEFGLELLPEFKPSGTIAFTIGPQRRALLNGEINITADSEGLLATGEIFTHIPGVDETKGTVTYRPSTGWAGAITITTSKIRYVRNANVTASFSDRGLDLAGGLMIVLPGEQTVSLSVHKRGPAAFVYTGQGVFNVPRLKPVEVFFMYDGEDVAGEAKTGFEFKTLKGSIDLKYLNGNVTGKARLEIDKSNGRLKGFVEVELNKNRKFSGQGRVSYEIKPGLVASAGILIDKDEKVTLDGELRFPPYELFKRHPEKPDRVNIFTFGPRKIPVPFLSFGSFGLNASIGAGMFLTYGIGPGMILDGFIKAKVNPLEEDPDPEFELGGRISIPINFSLTGYISGGILLDVFIAEAGGNITFSASGILNGEGGTKFSAKYAKGEFLAEADVRLVLEFFLQFCIDAYAYAEAGVWRFKVRTSKTWNLANYVYRPGLRFGIEGLKKPISYSSKTGFSLPSSDDIIWAKPPLEASSALKSGIDAARGEETEDDPKPRPPCPVIEQE